MPKRNSDARINFRLSSDLKKTIEDAAAEIGQSISDFAISTLVHAARKILHDQQVTRLSERDRQVFSAYQNSFPLWWLTPLFSLPTISKRHFAATVTL